MSIKRIFVWLCRIRHVRGFGVQSPSAYRFIRYVINEHYPYYAYNDLRDCSSALTNNELRLYRLYFRLSNYMQAPTWIDCSTKNNDVIRNYVNSGSVNTQFLHCDSISSISDFDVLRVNSHDLDNKGYEHLVSIASSHSMLIIEGIYSNKNSKELWKKIVDDERTGITYDLYDCGLVFFDKKKYKQNYIVNF